MKIVEYNHSYAEKVAKMWNMSNSSWGNDNDFQTADDIIAKESNSGNIKLYLAIDSDEVVGYCSFSEYQQDEGASYLPLLNVRPDYHGKKVGKALILKVLEDAIHSKWPRFDLYTWSGNIKAMPLYKKCGFFWEKDNNRVHLMNFIPYLYQTPALKDYLKQIDWYKDSIRKIDMTQDGTEQDGFDFYKYDFKNEQTALKVEFERFGRGLRLIETPEYRIEMSLSNKELVYNESYKATFHITNKNQQPLNIDIKGQNNKNIIFEESKYINVVDRETVELSFFVGKIAKPQVPSKTHPVVEADLYINGLRATFKIGLEPKSPLDITLITTKYNHQLNKTYTAYLDLENNLDHEEAFLIQLPNNQIAFESVPQIRLASKEKKSIPVQYTVSDFGIYKEEVTITYQDKQTKKFIMTPIKGASKSFYGIMDYEAWLVSGNYVLRYNIVSHNLRLINGYDVQSPTVFMAPQIGMPFTLEFSNAESEIEFLSSNEMEITYHSTTFKGVKIILYVKNEYGFVTVNYRLQNNGQKRKLGIKIPIWQQVDNCYIPYNGKILKLRYNDANLATLNQNMIDGNWIYHSKQKFGFIWDKTHDMKLTGWRMGVAKENIELDTDETFSLAPFYWTYIHPNLRNFREFLGYDKEKNTSTFQDVLLHNGNPFASGKTTLQFINNKKVQIEGTLHVEQKSSPITETIEITPGLKKIDVNLSDRILSLKRMLFKTHGSVETKQVDDTIIVSNGVIEFRASNQYSDSVYSLLFNDQEWLDSNYPTPKERSWWGTFTGGINFRANGIQDNAVLKEPRTLEAVVLKDNFKNEWKGVKISVSFEKEKNLKGFVFETYNLTLPGVPLLYSFTVVRNNTGKHQNKGYEKYLTFKLDDDPTKGRFTHENTTYKCGDINVEEHFTKLVTLSSSREYKLNIYNRKNELLMDSQKEYTILFSESWLDIPDGESKEFPGDFIFFTKESLEKEVFTDLENIRFEV